MKFAFKIYAKIRLYTFTKKLENSKTEQEKTLKKLLHLYKKTKYLKNKKSIKSYDDFKKHIPIVNYEDIRSLTEKDMNDGGNEISPHKVVIWETTSGSSGKPKIIGYNKKTLYGFFRYLDLWLSDLAINGPIFQSKKTFYSLSAPSIVDGNIDDDLDYFPKFIGTFLDRFLINPKKLKLVKDPHEFKIQLCSELISSQELEIIFIWSPSYLISLLSFIKQNEVEIIKYISVNKPLDKSKLTFITQNIGNWDKLWPNLKLISCWTEGAAKYFLNDLESIFPSVLIQGKGLIATEGVFSITLMNIDDSIPFLHNTFYEFMNKEGKVYKLDEVKLDESYELIITSPNGLLRYNLGDIVLVTGFISQTPLLKFIGRAGKNSDLTGEKLSEIALASILDSLGIKGLFLPYKSKDSTGYYCLLEEVLDNTQKNIEKKLCEIFHYNQSRVLNQLKEIKLIKVESLVDTYNEFYLNKGFILGDIKYSCLITSIEDSHDLLHKHGIII